MKRLSINRVTRLLIDKNITIFSDKDLSRLFNIKPATARSFLSRNVRRVDSSIIRIKRGIYATTINSPTKFEIANRLHKPSYISFETALSYYSIIPETVYAIISATTSNTKEINSQSTIYRYSKIKKNLFFGYSPKNINGKVIYIAEKEKALLDYIYFVSLKKQHKFNERINLEKIDKERLGYWVNYFKNNIRKNKTFIKLIKDIYKKL